MKWNEHRLLRVSVQIYNTQADIEALVSAVGRLSEEWRSPAGGSR